MFICVWTPNHLTKPSNAITILCRQSRMSFLSSHMQDNYCVRCQKWVLACGLDEESSYAATFGTPWGRCRWLRMPFVISPAPEEFQQRLDQALAGVNGCKAIADDILVFGCGANDDEAVKDHDETWSAALKCMLCLTRKLVNNTSDLIC